MREGIRNLMKPKTNNLRARLGERQFMNRYNGEAIQDCLARNNTEDVKKAKELLTVARDKYYENRHKKWLVCLLGLLIGSILGLGVP
jgi:hypothetical protein